MQQQFADLKRAPSTDRREGKSSKELSYIWIAPPAYGHGKQSQQSADTSGLSIGCRCSYAYARIDNLLLRNTDFSNPAAGQLPDVVKHVAKRCDQGVGVIGLLRVYGSSKDKPDSLPRLGKNHRT